MAKSSLAELGVDAEGRKIIYLPHRTQSVGRAIYSVYTMRLPNGEVRDVYFDQSHYIAK